MTNHAAPVVPPQRSPAPAGRRRPLVQETAAGLRELVFAVEPEAQIGSLPDLAKALGVGIVTVQQAARILEHEGLLAVRRGPGGGYYGKRPDAAALERSITAYMRMHPASFAEALDITSLLFNELVTTAAACADTERHAELARLASGIDACAEEAAVAAFETAFQDLLFRMVDRPLFELLTRVTLSFAQTRHQQVIGPGRDGVVGALDEWKAGRQRIIAAILSHDTELARFEANRSNRRIVLEALARTRYPD